ncbi:MAG: CPBP family intramembrane metalloprotease [Clostridia bacterium]|nr:CPBP family intramembrane metalloprotease [Clostridia bacterium]
MDNGNAKGMQYANPLLQHNSHIGGFALSLSAILYVLAGGLIAIIIAVARVEENSDAYLYLNYLAAPVAMTAAMGITLKFKKFPVKKAYPVKCHPKYFLIALLLIFGLIFSVSWIDTGVTEFLKLMGYVPKGKDAYLPNLSGGLIVPALIVIAVMPAIFEEGLFRGVILNSCEDGVGTVRTVFIVGFAFSLFHASAEQTVYQFLAGCVFAFIAIRAGSILPSVVMHFINNAIIIIFAACGLLDAEGNLILSSGAQIALIVVSAVSFIGGMIWLIFDKKPLIKCTKGSVKAFFIYASVGIVILGLMWILSFFVR